MLLKLSVMPRSNHRMLTGSRTSGKHSADAKGFRIEL
jgi:hypothetical protein